MEDTTILTPEKMQMAREQNFDLLLDMGGAVTWSIDVDSIDESAMTEVDMGVTLGTENVPQELISTILNGNKYLEVTLAHQGAFGFEPVLHIAIGKEYSGQYANLFYYDPEKESLEFVCDAVIGPDGVASLRFEHASCYLVIVSEQSMSGVSFEDESVNPATRWIMTGVFVFMILVVIGYGIFFFLKMKRGEEDDEENDSDDEETEDDMEYMELDDRENDIEYIKLNDRENDIEYLESDEDNYEYEEVGDDDIGYEEADDREDVEYEEVADEDIGYEEADDEDIEYEEADEDIEYEEADDDDDIEYGNADGDTEDSDDEYYDDDDDWIEDEDWQEPEEEREISKKVTEDIHKTNDWPEEEVQNAEDDWIEDDEWVE